MSEISTQETLADIESRLSTLEQEGTGIVKIAALTIATVAGAWFITGKIIDRKVARKIKAQEKANKKNNGK
jgi:uncharacterized membrane protein YciS (DUF1049 family)